MAAIEARLQHNNAELQNSVLKGLRQNIHNDSEFLTRYS
jgi:hypothetical protein